MNNCTCAVASVSGHGFSRAARALKGRGSGFLHLGPTAQYLLITALARLRERGDREAVGEGFVAYTRRKQPLTPGFAVPSPLGEGCYQLRTRCECKVSKNGCGSETLPATAGGTPTGRGRLPALHVTYARSESRAPRRERAAPAQSSHRDRASAGCRGQGRWRER
jgi:hypothetical protein